MTDLVSWLSAQIADDEAAARAANDEASDYRVVGVASSTLSSGGAAWTAWRVC